MSQVASVVGFYVVVVILIIVFYRVIRRKIRNMETLSIEYRCTNCNEIHTFKVEAPAQVARDHIMAELEQLMMANVRDLAVYRHTDEVKEDITAELIDTITEEVVVALIAMGKGH